MTRLTLTLMTRSGCHLCDDMAGVIATVAADLAADVEVRDVDGDPDLRELYGDEVPVLLINGRKAFKYRVTARELRRRLDAERRRQVGWWRRLF